MKVMKRTISLTARSRGAKLTLNAMVRLRAGQYSRSEAALLRDEWASRLMETVPGLPYIPVSLARVKVE